MSTASKPIPAEFLQMIAETREESFDDAVKATIATLHRMIEDVERARFQPSNGHIRTAAERAGTIAHTLTWGLANCNLQGLMSSAVEADAARAAVTTAQS